MKLYCCQSARLAYYGKWISSSGCKAGFIFLLNLDKAEMSGSNCLQPLCKEKLCVSHYERSWFHTEIFLTDALKIKGTWIILYMKCLHNVFSDHWIKTQTQHALIFPTYESVPSSSSSVWHIQRAEVLRTPWTGLCIGCREVVKPMKDLCVTSSKNTECATKAFSAHTDIQQRSPKRLTIWGYQCLAHYIDGWRSSPFKWSCLLRFPSPAAGL